MQLSCIKYAAQQIDWNIINMSSICICIYGYVYARMSLRSTPSSRDLFLIQSTYRSSIKLDVVVYDQA